MNNIVYGVFKSNEEADEALTDMGRGELLGETTTRTFTREPEGEELNLSATRAARWMGGAMLICGVLGAGILALMNPGSRMTFGLDDFFYLASFGSLFGLVAGAVAGMSEPRKELEPAISMARSGKTLVLMSEAGEREAKELKAHGAVYAGVA